MKLNAQLPTEKGTFGVWITKQEGGIQSDVHAYCCFGTHEPDGVIIGCNPTHSSKLKGTDPGLMLGKDGKASLQFFDADGNLQHRDLELATVHDAILAMLNGLKNKVD